MSIIDFIAVVSEPVKNLCKFNTIKVFYDKILKS